MLRSSDEHSARDDLRMSSPVEPQVQFASHVETIDHDDCSRNVISEAERAQIWAALSQETSKSSSLHHGHGDLNNGPHTVVGGGGGKDGSLSRLTKISTDDDKSSTKRTSSKVKKFGSAFKRIFMNDQTVPTSRSRRRDSWDDIYRCKDADKVRPIHEEYGAL
ncbi:protein of unknown function [Taphrina deformans PYCC 5710]|uniref:Uncharacterized protein n=1 Tax=Taphrina deformans (strain PYCC 5710 / ATCC 11124 / CBS 356.35 / IMI 108563 / JCM 9778 / NBRC 8474) TaxID=1097556 RepID=R4XK60_TAPDE|nr:protein of unknown function [Taphrina deformans PYCC 5710]|eukprot:CCG83703.1 protein of unknown function [Taphrina deformans PYCC 5710]